METFHWYRDYGIRYRTLGGTTQVVLDFDVVKVFPGLGEMRGREAAHAWVDAQYAMFGE